AVEVAGLGVGEFFEAIAAGRSVCAGQQADLDVMHLTTSDVTYGFLSARTQERADYRDPFIDLFDVVTGRETADRAPTRLRAEFVRSLIDGGARSSARIATELADDDTADDRVMSTIRKLHDGLVGRALDELVDAFNDLDMYRLIGAVRDLCGAAAIAAPFVL